VDATGTDVETLIAPRAIDWSEQSSGNPPSRE